MPRHSERIAHRESGWSAGLPDLAACMGVVRPIAGSRPTYFSSKYGITCIHSSSKRDERPANDARSIAKYSELRGEDVTAWEELSQQGNEWSPINNNLSRSRFTGKDVILETGVGVTD